MFIQNCGCLTQSSQQFLSGLSRSVGRWVRRSFGGRSMRQRHGTAMLADVDFIAKQGGDHRRHMPQNMP